MGLSILLIGVSGNVGAFLIPEFLRQRSSFNRVAILTDASRANKFAQVKKDGIEIVVGSFPDVESYRGFDVVLSLVRNPIMRLQSAMAELAIAAGVRHFYPSEYGAAVYNESNANLRYLRDKLVTRNHLAAKVKEVPAFHATYIVTGNFTEWSVSDFYGVDMERRVVNTYARPDSEICVTSTRDIARYTVDSLLMPLDANKGEREIRVVGSRLTFQQLIDTLGAAQGVEYRCTYLPLAEALAKQEQYRTSGDEALELMWSGKLLVALGAVSIPEPLDNGKFAFTPETAEETICRVFGNEE